MNEATICQRLTPILREIFDDDALTPTPETTPAEVEGWDSLSNIRLFVAVEKGFGIRFETRELGGIRSVGDLARLILAKIPPDGGGGT